MAEKLWKGSVACPADECRFRMYIEGDTEDSIDRAMTDVMLIHVDHDHPGFEVADIMPVQGGVVIPAGLQEQDEDEEAEILPRLIN